jgi:lysophospholipase L1-like esterase
MRMKREHRAVTPTPTSVFNLTDRWRHGVRRSLSRLERSERDFLYLNVGDSIATGEIGIDSPRHHYAAAAATIISERLGVRVGYGPATPGRETEAGRVALSGSGCSVLVDAGGFFGASAWSLGHDSDAVLRFTPEPPAAEFVVGVRSGCSFDFSLDGGNRWSRHQADLARTGTTAVRLPAPSVASGLLIRPVPGQADTVIRYLHAESRESPAFRWYTSGIGASQIHHLHDGLAAAEHSGYSTYGSIRPDLLTIEIGVNNTIHANDIGIAESRTQFASVVRSFLDQDIPGVAIIGPVPVRSDFQPGPWFVADAYRQIYRPVAREFGVPLVDWSTRWRDWTTAHRHGLIDDQVHPNRAGHEDAGAMVAEFLLAAGATRA